MGCGAAGGSPSLEEALSNPLVEGDPGIKRLSALKNHLVEKVKTEPAGATRLIQNWLHEGGVD